MIDTSLLSVGSGDGQARYAARRHPGHHHPRPGPELHLYRRRRERRREPGAPPVPQRGRARQRRRRGDRRLPALPADRRDSAQGQEAESMVEQQSHST